MVRLHTWLTNYPTQSAVTKAIVNNLTAWRKGQPTQPTTSRFLGLAQAIQDQTTAGWQLLLEGNPVHAWEEVQQHYFTWIKSRQTGKRWTVELIKKLWEVVWDLWEHRNSIVHDNKTGVKEARTRQEIQQEFATGAHSLPQQAKSLFSPGLTAILQMSLDSRQAWLIRVRSARARQERRRIATSVDTYPQEREVVRQFLLTATSVGALQPILTTTQPTASTATLQHP